MPDYIEDIDGGIFGYKVYSKSLFKPNLYLEAIKRYDAIVFDDNRHLELLIKYLRVGSTVDQALKNTSIMIMKDFWDCNFKEGVQLTIILY